SQLLLPPPTSPLSPYTTLFRSHVRRHRRARRQDALHRRQLRAALDAVTAQGIEQRRRAEHLRHAELLDRRNQLARIGVRRPRRRSEEHTSELQSREKLVCRLLL